MGTAMEHYERYLKGFGLEEPSSDGLPGQPLICEECCRYLVNQNNEFLWQVKEFFRLTFTAIGIGLQGVCLLALGLIVFASMLFPNLIQTSANRPVPDPRERDRKEREELERIESEIEERQRKEEELNSRAHKINELGSHAVTSTKKDRIDDDFLAGEWNHRINRIGEIGGSADEDRIYLEKLGAEAEKHRKTLFERDQKRRVIAGKIEAKLQELAALGGKIIDAEWKRDEDERARLLQQDWKLKGDLARLENEFRAV